LIPEERIELRKFFESYFASPKGYYAYKRAGMEKTVKVEKDRFNRKQERMKEMML